MKLGSNYPNETCFITESNLNATRSAGGPVKEQAADHRAGVKAVLEEIQVISCLDPMISA